MTDTTKNIMNDAIAATGESWKAALADLAKAPWSKLIASLGSTEHLLMLLGLQFDPSQNIPLRDMTAAHESAGTLEQFQAAMMHHIGEVVAFSHEKISAEVDRRFSLVKIN